MANAGEIKCLANPDFAVICSFLDKYGEKLGLPAIGYANLQEWIEDSRRVHPTLIEIHVRLLRKALKKGFNMQSDRWEKGIVKYCHRYSAVDAWEIERFGYKIAKVSTKLTLLKNLLESQFDSNTKFKEKLNDVSAEDMRCQPLGRDKNGLAYWYFLDNELNLRIFREDQDDVADETWELVCRTREDLARLIDNLEKGFDTKLEKPDPSDLSEPTSDANEDSRDSFYSTKQKGSIGPSPLTIKQEPVENGASDTPGSETDSNLTDSKIVLKIKQGKCEVDSPTKQLKDKFEKEKGLQLKKIKCRLKEEENIDSVEVGSDIEEDDFHDDIEDTGADTNRESVTNTNLDSLDKDPSTHISNRIEGCAKEKELAKENDSRTENNSNNQEKHLSNNEDLNLVSKNEKELENEKPKSISNDVESEKGQGDYSSSKEDHSDAKKVTKSGVCNSDTSDEKPVDKVNSDTDTSIRKDLDQKCSKLTENSDSQETKREISQTMSVAKSSENATNNASNDSEKDKVKGKCIDDDLIDSTNGDLNVGSKSTKEIDTNIPQNDKPCDKTLPKGLKNEDSKILSKDNEIDSNNSYSSIIPNDTTGNQKVDSKDGEVAVKSVDIRRNSTSSKNENELNSDSTKCKLPVIRSDNHQPKCTSNEESKDESPSDLRNTKFDQPKDNHTSQKLDEKSEQSSDKNFKDLGKIEIKDKTNEDIVSDKKDVEDTSKDSINSLKNSDGAIDTKEPNNQECSKEIYKEESEKNTDGQEQMKNKNGEVESNLKEAMDDFVKNDAIDLKASSSEKDRGQEIGEKDNVKAKINRKRKKDEISNTPNESSTDDEPEITLSPEAKTRKIKTVVRKSTNAKEIQSVNDIKVDSLKDEDKSSRENAVSKNDKSMEKLQEEDKFVSDDKGLDSDTGNQILKRNKNESIDKNRKAEDKISKSDSSKAASKSEENTKETKGESDDDENGDIEMMLDGSDVDSDQVEDKATVSSNNLENDQHKVNSGNQKVMTKEDTKRNEVKNDKHKLESGVDKEAVKDESKKTDKQSSSEDDLSASEGTEPNVKGVRSKAKKRQANESPEESPTEPASKRSKLRGRVLSRGRGKRSTQGSPSDNSSSTEDDDTPLSQMAGRGRRGRGRGRGKGVGARRKKSQPRKEGTAVKKKKVDEEAFDSASETDQKIVKDKHSSEVKADGKTVKDSENEDTDVEEVSQVEKKSSKTSKKEKEAPKPSKDVPVESEEDPGVRRSARVRSLRARKKKSPSPEYFPSENEELNNDDDYEFDCDEDLDDDDEEFSLRRKRKQKPVPIEEELPKGRNALRYEAKTNKKVHKEESEEEPEDETPCCRCLKNEQPEWILLCDKCDAGYHTACLRPPLMVIPDGDWFCPPCEQNDLVLKLTENLKNLDQSILKNDRLQRRKERLAYVSISLDNVLKEDTDTVEKKSAGKAKSATQKSKKSKTKLDDDSSQEETEEEGSGSSSGSDSSGSDNSRSRSSESDRPRSRSHRGDQRRRRKKRRQSSESDEDSPPSRFAQRKCRSRNPVSYKFEEFEEMIADAIHDDISIPKEPKPKKVKPLGISRGKDMSNILGVSDEESKPKAKKKRKPRLTELDEEFDDDDTDDYKMSDASGSSSASKSYQSDASDLSGEDSVGRRESRRGTRRSSRRNGRRFGRYRDDFVVDSDFDSTEERQAVRRPRRKTAKYVDYNTETEEEESLATSDLDDSDFEEKRKKKLKRKEKKKQKQKKSKSGSGKRHRIKRVSSSEESESESEDSKPSKKKKGGKKRSEDEEENSGSETEEETSKRTSKTNKKKVTRRIEDSEEESGSSEGESERDKNTTRKDTGRKGEKNKKSKNVIDSDTEEDLDESSDKKNTKKGKDETSSNDSNDDDDSSSSSSSDESDDSNASDASHPSAEDEEGWEEIGVGSNDEVSSPRAKKSPCHATKEKIPCGKMMYAAVVAKKLPDTYTEKFTSKIEDAKISDESPKECEGNVGDTNTQKLSKVDEIKGKESTSRVNDTKMNETTNNVGDTKINESKSEVINTKTNESASKVNDTKTSEESSDKAENKTGKKGTVDGTAGKPNDSTPKKRGRKPKKATEDAGQDTQGEESPVKKKRGKKTENAEAPTNKTTDIKPETSDKIEDKSESDKAADKKDDSPLQSRNNQNAPVGVVKPEVRQGVIVENKQVIDARAGDNRGNENMVSPLQGMREMAMRNQGNQGPEYGNFGPYQGGNSGPYPNRGIEGGYMGPQGFQNYPQGQGQYGQGMQGSMQGHPYGGMPQGHPQGMPQQQGPMNQGGPMNPNQQPQPNYPSQGQGQGPMSPNTYHQNNQYMPQNMQQPPAGFYQGPYQMGPDGQQNFGYGGQGPHQGPPNQNYPQGNFPQGQYNPQGYHPQQGPFPNPEMQGPPYMNQQGPQPQMGPQGQFQSQQGPPYQNMPYNYPHVPQPRHPPGYGPQPGHIQGGNPNQPFRPEPQAPGPQYHQLQTVNRQGMGSPGQVNSPNQGMGSPQTSMGSPGTVINSSAPVKPTSQNSDQKLTINTVEKEETKPQTSTSSHENPETDKPNDKPRQDSTKEPSPKTQAVEPTQRKGFMMANILKPKSETSEEQTSSKSSE